MNYEIQLIETCLLSIFTLIWDFVREFHIIKFKFHIKSIEDEIKYLKRRLEYQDKLLKLNGYKEIHI